MREECSSHPTIACAHPNLKRTLPIKNSWPFSASSPPMKTMAMLTINALVTGLFATPGAATLVRKGKSAYASLRTRQKRAARRSTHPALATFRPKCHGHKFERWTGNWPVRREKGPASCNPIFRIYDGLSSAQLIAHHQCSVLTESISLALPPPSFRQIKPNYLISPFYISFL